MKNHTKKGAIALKKAYSSLGNVLELNQHEEVSHVALIQQIHAVSGLLKSATYHILSAYMQQELSSLGDKKKTVKKNLEELIDDIGSVIKLSQKK